MLMTYLTHNGAVRAETDAEIIGTLKRKGWVETEAPPAPESPPVVVSMRALQFALAAAGLYAAVKAAACSTVEGEIWWTTSPTVARNHAFVAQLATALGQSDTQIDAIFATAQASAL